MGEYSEVRLGQLVPNPDNPARDGLIVDILEGRTPNLPAATVAWVETELAAHLNRLATAVRRATAERDQAIATARAAGHSARDIALATGLSHPTVLRIVERRGEEGAS